jgi:hypothetical protein
MEPTSPLAGVLTGLIDGTIIVLAVFAVIYVAGRRNHPKPAPAVHPVAEDGLPEHPVREGELPKLG